MTNKTGSLRVLVAGAGIGGLTLAVALRRAGASVRVFERAPRVEPVGAGIVVQPNAMLALRSIDPALEQAVAAAGQPCVRGAIKADSGAVLSSTDLGAIARLAGAPMIGIHRHRLHETLLEALGEGHVSLGAAARGCREEGGEVILELEGGDEARGDVLVGADGLRSAVRAHVLGPDEVRYSGYTSWRGVCAGADLVPPGHQSETWGRGQRFGIVGIGHGEVYWFATANAPPGGEDPPGARVASLIERFGGWHEPIRALLERTEESRAIRSDIGDRAPVRGWTRGRVGLLGDAAHPTTPNLGQGGCMAIEDAAVLGRLLPASGAAGVAGALKRYEERRVARANEVVARSWNLGRVAQLENPLGRAVRNAAVRWTPESVMRSQMLEFFRFSAD